jgi:radical SAM superfamily enzyme YgiQ (UPF0313 family)
VEAVYHTGFRGTIFIVDDNFVGRHAAAKEVLRALRDWQRAHRFPFRFSTEASLDLAGDRELLELLADTGFEMIFVGLETPVEESLRATGKKQNLVRGMNAYVREIQKHGIEVSAGFIVGFDNDPKDIFARQRKFIRALAVPTAMVGLLMALPETRLFRRLKAEGRILGRSSGNNTHQVELNFEPRLPRKMLVEGYRRLLVQLYSPRRYFARCLRFVIRLPRRDITRKWRRRFAIGAREIRAVLTSLVRQGASRYSFWYFSFLVRAIAMRPREIARFITLAIKGHHYFVITREMGLAE